MKEPIRVVIADDSPTERYHLSHIVGGTADMHVVGQAQTGAEAVELVVALQPDVVLMDIKCPR